MTPERLEDLFYENEYAKISSNLPEYAFYWHRENLGVTVLFVIDYRAGIYISGDQYAHMKERIIDFFREKGEGDVHILSLIICADTKKARKLCADDRFCWIIDADMDRLLIYEEQVPDFYGWKPILEDFMTRASDNSGYRSYSDGVPGKKKGTLQEKWSRERLAGLPWVNIGLVIVNVIIFLICTFSGELLYNKGASGVMEVVRDGSYYRMITSMFLHANVGHLFSNMIVLYYVGEIVEKKIGHIPYAALYFLSGIAGDLFSMGYEFLSKEYHASVGASGAVFGVEGALLFLVIANRGKMEYVTADRLVFAIAFSLYCGFTGTNVNNAAHVGGVLMGFASMAVIMMLKPRGRTGKDRTVNEN